MCWHLNAGKKYIASVIYEHKMAHGLNTFHRLTRTGAHVIKDTCCCFLWLTVRPKYSEIRERIERKLIKFYSEPAAQEGYDHNTTENKTVWCPKMTNNANKEIKEFKMASSIDEENMCVYRNNWIQRWRRGSFHSFESCIVKLKEFSKKDFHI